MKRRTFITSIFGAAVASAAVTAPIVYGVTHKKEVVKQSATFVAKRKARALFQRFFKTATTFNPTPTQMFWYDCYDSNTNIFSGARQTGMTTLMLVIALFEKKCLGVPNNVILCYNTYWEDRIKVALDTMEDRLGKSVKDGRIDVCRPDSVVVRGRLYDKSFIMNDANVLCDEFQFKSSVEEKRFGDCFAKKHMFFGTHESRPPYDPSNFRSKLSKNATV